MLQFSKQHSLAILSGIFIGTSFIPFVPWAAFFGFVPLWIYWNREVSLKKILISGWICQFVFTFIGFNWVAHTIHVFGHMPLAFAFVGLLIFCSFANLYVVIVGLVWFYLRKHFALQGLISIAVLGGLTCLGEVSVPTIFDWNFGYTWLWINWPAYQLADVIGFYGISCIVILCNILFFYIYQNRKNKGSLKGFAVFLALILLLSLLGIWRKSVLQKPDAEINVAIVQANIGNLEKQYAEKGWGFRQHILDEYVGLSREVVSGSDRALDFVVWPETAFPDRLGPSFMYNSVQRQFVEFIADLKTAFVVGAYSFDDHQQKPTNSMFFINQNGSFADSHYFKTRLLAWGEYIPGAQWFPQVKAWLPQVSDFARGPGPSVKTLNGLKIGAQICYESLFPLFTLGLAEKGAQVIVNVTNDSWYGEWMEPYQHGYMTLARAIEVRLPLIRATNTGISTVILANGDILEKSPLGKKWAGIYKVPYVKAPEATFYQKFYWLPYAFILIMVAILLTMSWRKRQ